MGSEIQTLRQELKEWEKSFAASNEGRKAEREDIKQHAEIASKYKLYNKLRLHEEGQCTSNDPPKHDRNSKKRPATTATLPPASTRTPQKKQRSKHLQPPQPQEAIFEEVPSPAQETPFPHRDFIGPTPQKNGRVLGLFDLLTPSSTWRTPSKRQFLAPLPENVVGTPSRARAQAAKHEGGNAAADVTPVGSQKRKRSRSPPSTSKRAYLNTFLTPSTRRFCSDVGNTPDGTKPVSALNFGDTPAFLKRDSQCFAPRQRAGSGANDGDAEDSFSWSPVAVRRPMRPKSVMRGLSALVKGLRQMEDAKLDEEMEMLREMEGGGQEQKQSLIKNAPKICVKDSQAPEMPLGPDGQGQSEDDDDVHALKADGMDRNGKPLKIWKKKGQKRTTRQVKIRPNTAKWKPEPAWKGGREVDSEDEVVAVEETQLVPDGQAKAAADEIDDLQTEDEYVSDGSGDGDDPKSKGAMKVGKQRGKAKKSAESKPVKEKKKKAVSATAHANFRALKIKNKQSKGKGRGSAASTLF
ncbi:MAG: hypothetical protein Q9212_003741 [Teloschistes hypoglaucus]